MFERIKPTQKRYLFMTVDTYIWEVRSRKHTDFSRRLQRKAGWFRPDVTFENEMSWLWDLPLCREVFEHTLNKQWWFYPNGIRLFCV